MTLIFGRKLLKPKRATATPTSLEYCYAPLSENPPYIRLLTLLAGEVNDPLQGHLTSFDLQGLSDQIEGALEWEALSYCWGPTPSSEWKPLSYLQGNSAELRSFLISGKVLKITRSLFTALGHLRLTDKPRNIWIDQICVNQRDLKERSQQVQHMKFIYENANSVTAWLGEGDQDSDIYMSLLCAAQDLIYQGLFPSRGRPSSQEEALLYTTLASDPALKSNGMLSKQSTQDQIHQYLAKKCGRFGENAWFERIWIIQEAVLTNNLVFQYGKRRARWKVHCIIVLSLFRDDVSSTEGFYSYGIDLTTTMYMLKTRAPDLSARRGLFSLVNALKRQNATDGRDRVYGVLGLVDPQALREKNSDSTFPVDYAKSTAQLSKDLVLWHIANVATLDVLSVCCSAGSSPNDVIPSWAISLETSDFCDRIFLNITNGPELRCAGIKNVVQSRFVPSVDALLLTGLDFDTVQQVSAKTHTYEKLGVSNSNVWCEWTDLALKQQSEDPYRDTGGREEALWRTLLANEIWDENAKKVLRAPARLGDQFRVWKSRQDLLSTDDAMRKGSVEGDSRFVEFLENIGWEAKIFRTRRGFLGLSCRHVKPGDKVAILWGGRCPFLLRECKRKRTIPAAGDGTADSPTHHKMTAYRLVGGQVYVHGIAEGEGSDIAEREGTQPQQFCLV